MCVSRTRCSALAVHRRSGTAETGAVAIPGLQRTTAQVGCFRLAPNIGVPEVGNTRLPVCCAAPGKGGQTRAIGPGDWRQARRSFPFSVSPKGEWSAGRRQGFARPVKRIARNSESHCGSTVFVRNRAGCSISRCAVGAGRSQGRDGSESSPSASRSFC